MNIYDFLAKSKREGGTTLISHSIASINVSAVIARKYVVNLDEIFPETLYSNGFHDIGKIKEDLQKFYQGLKKAKDETLTNDSSDPLLRQSENIPHNVVSWAFIKNNTSFGEYSNIFDSFVSSILYHHVVDGEYDNPSSIISKYSDDIANMNEFFCLITNYIKNTFGVDSVCGKKVCLSNNKDKKSSTSSEVVYPIMDDIGTIKDELKEFSEYFLLRAIQIFSDRLVSSLSREELDKFVSNDIGYIESYLNSLCAYSTKDLKLDYDTLVENGYDGERLNKQFDLAEKIVSNKNVICSSSAGSGKTLLGILVSVMQGKKTIWVVPTNFTAISTYESITRELSKMGLNVSVSLYYGGQFVKNNENSDILITNIDTFLGTMVKNSISHWLFKFLNGTVIFDEYHEFVCSPKAPMFSAFIGTAYCLMKHTASNILLMSATAHRYDEIFWGEPLVKFIKADVYGADTPIQIKIKTYRSIDEFIVEKKDSIAVMHSIPNVTDFGSKHIGENYIFAHTRFPENEIYPKLLDVIDNHGKNGSPSERRTLVGTSFLGFALDITTDNMYDFVVSPDTTIQRGAGRVNRFCNSNNLGTYNMCLFTDGRTPNIISSSYDKNLFNRWVNLMSKFDGEVITKGELYILYNKFYEDNKLDIMNFYHNRFVSSSQDLSSLLPYHSRCSGDVENKKLPKNNKTFRGVTDYVYVVAYKEDGTVCSPIKMRKDVLSAYEAKTNPLTKNTCKEQYKFLTTLQDKYTLESCGVKTWMDIWGTSTTSLRYDISRRYNTPLLLTRNEAIFIDELGLLLLK